MSSDDSAFATRKKYTIFLINFYGVNKLSIIVAKHLLGHNHYCIAFIFNKDATTLEYKTILRVLHISSNRNRFELCNLGGRFNPVNFGIVKGIINYKLMMLVE